MNEQLSIGIDIGGSRIKYGVVSDKGKILWEHEIPTNSHKGRNFLINTIVECISEAKSMVEDGNINCVGIGTPGLIDIDHGFVKGGAFQLPEWHNLPLASIISEKTNLPIYVDNDANLVGLSEYVFGLNGQGDNLIFLTIGTGIGGAIIINGELYRGSKYAGAELGCFPIKYGDELGYWEVYASTLAMINDYRDNSTNNVDDKIDGKFIVSEYLQGYDLAVKVMNRHTDLVGMGVGGLINIFNPENVVIGGGISEAGDFYIDKIRDSAKKHAMQDCFEGVSISAATLGNKAGFLGAGYFAIKQNSKININL